MMYPSEHNSYYLNGRKFQDFTTPFSFARAKDVFLLKKNFVPVIFKIRWFDLDAYVISFPRIRSAKTLMCFD